MTNYELIKNMSIEELAVTITCPNETGMAEIDCDKSDDCNCCQCCLDWLNKESGESEFVIPETTPEMCSNCMREVEIPGNEPSKCPVCGEDLLPCSTCYDQIDGKKWCDWDINAGCWRFPKT